MLQVFTKIDHTQYSTHITPMWDVHKDRVTSTLKSVLEYHRGTNKRVVSNHILSRIIKHIDVDITKNIFEYLEDVDSKYMYASKNQHVSSSINKGKVIDNGILSSGSSILISRDFNVDLFNLDSKYIDECPIRPIRHSSTSLTMNHPDNMGEDLDISVFFIDIRLMMVQYKYWANNRLLGDFDIDPSVFVYTIVLSNLIPAMFDIALLNRYYSDEPILYNAKKTTPMSIQDFHDNTDRILSTIRKDNSKRSMNIIELLRNIPMISYNNAYELLFSRPGILNNNNRWCEFIGYSYIVIKILNNFTDRDYRINKKLFSRLYRKLLLLKRSKSIYGININGLEFLIENEFEILLLESEDRR